MGLLERAIGLDRVHISRRLATAGVLVGATAILASIAAAFLALAVYLLLKPSVGAIGSAVLIAAGAAGLAAVLAFAATAVLRRARQDMTAAVRASAVATMAPAAMGLVGKKAGLIGAGIALLAGFLAARRR